MSDRVRRHIEEAEARAVAARTFLEEARQRASSVGVEGVVDHAPGLPLAAGQAGAVRAPRAPGSPAA